MPGLIVRLGRAGVAGHRRPSTGCPHPGSGWTRGLDRVESNWLARVALPVRVPGRHRPLAGRRRRMYDRLVDVPRLVAFFGWAEALPDPVAEVMAMLCESYRNEPAGPFRTVGAWPLPHRPGQRGVARGHHRVPIGRRHLGGHRVAGRAATVPAAAAQGGGRVRRFSLGHGDLLVMGGSCQHTWEHACPRPRVPWVRA